MILVTRSRLGISTLLVVRNALGFSLSWRRPYVRISNEIRQELSRRLPGAFRILSTQNKTMFIDSL